MDALFSSRCQFPNASVTNYTPSSSAEESHGLQVSEGTGISGVFLRAVHHARHMLCLAGAP